MNKKAKEYILLLLLLVVYIVLFPNDIFRCNMNSDQNENLLNEELNVICDGEESEGSENECEDDSVSKVCSVGERNKRGYTLSISQGQADSLYESAGKEENEVNNDTVIFPSPHILTTYDEMLVMEAKSELNVLYDLDNFQVILFHIGQGICSM